MIEVSRKLKAIEKQIAEACEKSNRRQDEIKIIAVTKYVSVERTLEAVKAGIYDLGENRDEGLQEKWNVLKDKPRWHFIGSLQTRKVRNIIDKVEYIHSLDRLSLAEEIDKRASGTIKCLIQVNVSGEKSKHGLAPHEVLDFVRQLDHYKNIQVAGLMTMAPYTEDEVLLRSCFKKLSELRSSVIKLNLSYAPCNELSMGMSNDFHIAIEEGATMVRIGTALVGEDDEEVQE